MRETLRIAIFGKKNIKLAFVFSTSLRIHWDSVFWTFLAGQQSKLTKKLHNSAPNMFLAANEPEEQDFFL
jgi:hypothetical protein